MKTRDAFALKSFKPAQILQRPYFREFGFGADKTDDEILAGLRYADGDSRQDAETKFDTLCRLIRRTSEYLKFVKRHVDRLERYRRAVADKIVEGATADVESLRAKYAREQKLASFYTIEFFFDADSLLEKMNQAFRALDDAIKLSYRRVFADRLKTARQAAGMNQTEFGASLGLSQRAISNYESADREPSIANIVRFAQKLRRPLNWFFGAN